MKNALYWLWLQRAFGYSACVADPVRYFGGVKQLFEATENDYRACELFGKTRSFSSSRLRLLNNKDLSFAQSILEQCESFGIKVITPEDVDYPKKLLKLPDYPAVLFVKGDLATLNERLCVAVIGSREPSDYAKTAAHEITCALSSQGAVIVSGGALGVDSIGHKAALECKQKTVLVLGCGIETHYLSSNAPLRAEISRNGALVSEFPPTLEPTAGSFPQRNRIISGVSDAVLIVQAGDRSGTLNTAKHAKNQGRPLFVVPGPVSSSLFAGSNRLIREGAKPVFSAEDIFAHFDMVYALQGNTQPEISFSEEPVSAEPAESKPKKQRKAAPKEQDTSEKNAPCASVKQADLDALLSKVSPNAASVYRCIIDGSNQMDEIVLSAALPTAKVLSALTELELFGLISKGEGNYYSVNDTNNVII